LRSSSKALRLPLTSDRVCGRYFSTKSIEIEHRNQEIQRIRI
jgi:hypothetical protein